MVKPVYEPDLFDDPAILGISENHRVTPAQILIAWSVMRNIAVIPKSVNKDRLMQNLKAADIMLNDEEINKISELDRNYRYVSGKFWAMPGSTYTLEDLWGENL
jgi:alcohol dehydrogenase (NADP+)